MRRIAVLVVGWAAVAGLGPVATAQDADGKLKQRVEKIDEKLAKALGELAAKYSEDGDVETAHFFAEWFRGLGRKDEKIQSIWIDWELKVYLGKDQGGRRLEKTAPIRQKLDSLKSEYKKLLAEVLDSARKDRRELTDAERAAVHDCAVKYELSRGAEEYIGTIKRVNELRRGMKLRGVLWDFAASRKFVLGCAAAAETLSLYAETEKSKTSPFYSAEAVKFMVENSARGYGAVAKWADEMRAYGLVREELLNPNVRRLWLGHWRRLDDFEAVTAYRIPQLPYREDMPTPSQRHERATVVKDWVDTEEVFEVDGKKIPYARYPFEGETDLPSFFGEPGPKGTEEGWSKTEHEFTKTAGLPVMLRFFGKAKLTDVEAKLTTKSGKEVQCRTYANGDERVPGIGEWPTILVVAERELDKGVTYTISIKAKVDETPFEKSWSFTTREGR